MGNSEDIKSVSGQVKYARTYRCGKYKDVEKRIQVSNDQHGTSEQETLVKEHPF